MARIRHLAIRCADQPKLAAFYVQAFGMSEVFRHPDRNNTVAIYLSDGAVNLAIIPHENREALDHFGFEVDDIAQVSGAALAAGATAGPERVPVDGRQNEAFIKDPIGQRVDLSTAGWRLGGTGKARIRHVAVSSADPPKLADFYARTFGLHEVFRRPWERGAVYLSDGHINLALLPIEPDQKLGGVDRGAARPGINHFGFHVDDVEEIAKSAYALGAKPNDYALPRDGRFAETFLFDPIGGRVDLSAVGWKLQP